MKSIQVNRAQNTRLGTLRRFSFRAGIDQGFMMIELMISMVVLSVGLAGVLVLLISAMYTDKRSGSDTSATMVAEHVLEQITAQGQGAGLGAPQPLQITDCSAPPNNVRNLPTNRAALGAGNSGAFGGFGAVLTAGGVIDWTQNFNAVANDPASGFPYAIEYVACGANGRQVTYDVRWNIIQISGNVRMTVIGARTKSSTQVGGLKFAVPVNLRTLD